MLVVTDCKQKCGWVVEAKRFVFGVLFWHAFASCHGILIKRVADSFPLLATLHALHAVVGFVGLVNVMCNIVSKTAVGLSPCMS